MSDETFEYAARCPDGEMHHIRPVFSMAERDAFDLNHWHRKDCRKNSHVVWRRPVGEWEQVTEEIGTLL